MKVDFKKLTASTLSVAMLASLAGCAMFDKDDDAVLAVVEYYAEAVKKFKAGDIAELSSNVDDEWTESLEAYFSTDADLYGEDYGPIIEAIESTLSYEIDEESVESSKKDGEASVDITWSIVDYATIYDDVIADGGDLDAYLAALADGDSKEISQTINLVYDDEEWLVEDKDNKNLEEVYAFFEDALEYQFAAAISTDLIDYVEWYYSDNGVYTDVSTIELDIIPTTEGQEVEWEFYYEYYRDGQLVFTSDACTDSGYWIESYYGPGYDPAAMTDDNGYLIAGSYECIVYDMAGNVLADDTCTVENGGASTVVVPGGSGDVDESVWSNGTDQYWYSYSDGTGYAMGEGDYSTSESVIEYTVQVYDEASLAYFPVYYEVYYSESGNLDDAEFVYSATITPSEYSNGYFYEFQYVDNAGLDAGSYFFVGATDATGSCMLFNAEATVS